MTRLLFLLGIPEPPLVAGPQPPFLWVSQARWQKGSWCLDSNLQQPVSVPRSQICRGPSRAAGPLPEPLTPCQIWEKGEHLPVPWRPSRSPCHIVHSWLLQKDLPEGCDHLLLPSASLETEAVKDDAADEKSQNQPGAKGALGIRHRAVEQIMKREGKRWRKKMKGK